MKRTIPTLAFLMVTATHAFAAVRVHVNLGVGHPLRRPARTVIVRPVRPAVVVPARVTYAAPVAWTKQAVVVRERDHVVWQDSERLDRHEDWVDSCFGVNARGGKLYLRVNGKVQVDFAEVYFDNGRVQVVDFHEDTLNSGTYTLLNFPDGRKVDSVRIIARARTGQVQLTVGVAR